MPFLVITHFNKFLAFYDVYKYNMEEMMLPPWPPPPRDACVLPTSKVNGGIIVVLFKYVRPSGLVYGAHTCEDCHSIYSISLTGNIHMFADKR